MNKLLRVLFLPVLVLPILAIGLCLSSPAATNPTKPAQTSAHVDDAQLESNIRSKLAKSKIGRDGFRFKVSRGIVTWEGSTLIPQHKGAATRMARSSGAVQVINNIQVEDGNKPGTPAKKAYVQ
jgi:osmotically-inducible protein OsmY